MRAGENDQVVDIFTKTFPVELVHADASERFFADLKGVTDPEQKRKIIGAEFIRVFEEEARKLEGIEFLAQGTIYPDIIESGTKTVKAVKSHHNVGGLPKELGFESLVEPLRMLFKDEVRRLGVALGAKKETFAGLAGVGDLIVTCTSMHSRNRRAGILIGQGKDPQAAMKEVGAVVEGYYAAKSAYELGKAKGIDMPITDAAYKVLYEGADVRKAVQALLSRQRKSESEDAGWQ